MAKTHTFQRGETIEQIADQNSFRAWEPIWMHPNNVALRAIRPNAHVLAEGDKLFIPDKKLQTYDCETNRRHVFRVGKLKQRLRQVLLNANHQPLAGKDFELNVAGKSIQDTTGSDGIVQADIPVSAKTATLKVWMSTGDESSAVTWELQLGKLEPVESTFGLKAHLFNLGYDCGNVNDQFDEKTTQALKAFQRDHQLPVTGNSDTATRDKLRSIHSYPLEA